MIAAVPLVPSVPFSLREGGRHVGVMWVGVRVHFWPAHPGDYWVDKGVVTGWPWNNSD